MFSVNMNKEKNTKRATADTEKPGAIPVYLEDRKNTERAKVLSNMVKQKRKEKAGKWDVPLPKVRPIPEAELFRVIKSGKRQSTQIIFALRSPYFRKELEANGDKGDVCW